jgi:hypothetical protein
MSILDWRGNDLAEKVTEAVKAGINDTLEAAAEDARGTTMDLPPHEAAGHPWYGFTSRVENAVDIQEAEVDGQVVVGRFGATKQRGDYAFFLERLHPYLRPAADRNFTDLAENIQKRLAA